MWVSAEQLHQLVSQVSLERGKEWSVQNWIKQIDGIWLALSLSVVSEAMSPVRQTSGSLVSFLDCRNSQRTRPAGSSGAQCSPTGLHRHPCVAKYTCVYDVEAASNMAYSAACSSSASQSSPTRIGLLWRLPPAPVFPVSEMTVWKKEHCVQVF